MEEYEKDLKRERLQKRKALQDLGVVLGLKEPKRMKSSRSAVKVKKRVNELMES